MVATMNGAAMKESSCLLARAEDVISQTEANTAWPHSSGKGSQSPGKVVTFHFKFDFFFNLRDKEMVVQLDKARSSFCQLVPQMFALAVLCCRLEAGMQTRSPMWVARSLLLGSSLPPPKVCISRKVESSIRTKYWTQVLWYWMWAL